MITDSQIEKLRTMGEMIPNQTRPLGWDQGTYQLLKSIKKLPLIIDEINFEIPPETSDEVYRLMKVIEACNDEEIRYYLRYIKRYGSIDDFCMEYTCRFMLICRAFLHHTYPVQHYLITRRIWKPSTWDANRALASGRADLLHLYEDFTDPSIVGIVMAAKNDRTPFVLRYIDGADSNVAICAYANDNVELISALHENGIDIEEQWLDAADPRAKSQWHAWRNAGQLKEAFYHLPLEVVYDCYRYYEMWLTFNSYYL